MSSDGSTTATVNTAQSGVDLLVNFASQIGDPTTNLLPNPSDEAVVGMTAETGTSVARSTAQKFVGMASAALTCTTAGTVAANCGVGVNGVPVSPGQVYTASAYVRANTTGRVAAILIDWYTGTGAYVSSSVGTGSADSTTWGRRTASGAAPATARFATIKVTFNSVALAEVHYVDARQLERGAVATAYCDGAQAGCAWIGAANASKSYRPPYMRLTVRRSDGSIVRGLDDAIAVDGQAVGADFEAPRGVAVSYTATLSNGLASISSGTMPTLTVPQPSYTAYLKSLYDPRLSVPVRVRYPDWSDAPDVGVFSPFGTRQATSVESDTAVVSGSLLIRTRSAAQLTALRALLASPGPYLLQGSPESLEPDVYVTRTGHQQARPFEFSKHPTRDFTVQVVQVGRPATAGSSVVNAGHTYNDDTGGTWAADTALAQTYTQWLTL